MKIKETTKHRKFQINLTAEELKNLHLIVGDSCDERLDEMRDEAGMKKQTDLFSYSSFLKLDEIVESL